MNFLKRGICLERRKTTRKNEEKHSKKHNKINIENNETRTDNKVNILKQMKILKYMYATL